ncbi:hypothetical protein E3O42_00795 [Cryobacterium adonitolivorans]|uniref:Uncharacterized protein n=1 Tax=Cryobacterium adonitolivorans TaxID=1259189 RepID=A0A4R8WCF3_9MICO|nr:hypothetical protein [Cryobacterium adonitolivorans]TFC06953.1 hypothetical protein E3O42_00795 [Cryobacterium adonitolivorans]
MPAWRSTVAPVSAVLVAAYGVIDASWDAAFNCGDELDASVAFFAFDLGRATAGRFRTSSSGPG